ncbi:MAG: single-stranded DNA-binding protein [Alistipes sp.]|nr:single-stranded DNA-binding protein [Alistipes sp.]
MINKVILVGNVGMDPEVRTTESGVKMARLRLATTERYTDRQTNETKEMTEWHTIILWRGLANVVDSYVKKGSQIYIEGRLRTREWTDKDNIKRYSTEILADDMKLLGRRGDNQQSGTPVSTSAQTQPQQAVSQPATPVVPQDDPDDLPF